MAVVNLKDAPNKRSLLGQYFTPEHVARFCLDRTKIETELIIEPSCGHGVFVDLLDRDVIALEVDIEREDFVKMNFYDFGTVDKDVSFIGNVPFHVPAASVTDHPIYGRKKHIKYLKKKYGIKGIREEAVFFIINSVDIILKSRVRGHIYYILPKSVFHNNSTSYQTFFAFLKKYVKLEEVWDLGKDFDNVNTDLCYAHFSVGYKEPGGAYGIEEKFITFHKIFKKTYLGSVPCESVLMSVRGESLEQFQNRLIRLFSGEFDEENLKHGGVFHLASLNRGNREKLEVVKKYVEEIKGILGAAPFGEGCFYKPIQHRNEVRYYFRHEALKKASFVYQLNPNPCPSFYFPGNPVKGCHDYWGFCEFDVNRNCSPSANRTVPLEGDYLTDEFKEYWRANTDLPFECVFDYLSYVLGSEWYKNMKNNYQRFYCCIPEKFDEGFYETLLARCGDDQDDEPEAN